ncbi:peptide ABC transporter substrate-binding protein [Ktedonospora formicarum]|uniref:ABC transporter substrate-binding protein n=1 Tax=Ktedonospora formicarum TaxID=2778364 RepID=A0A8J3I2D3_9CHLR|nr:peptide ABC transporter substrate-binding protein [Ktedonospora formicarum]GHO45458.1 ABC transporter substrate-binding protein [Ktedonospora formicarum]
MACILLLLLSAACANTSATSGKESKATNDKQIAILPISGIADIQTFDPGLTTDLTSAGAISMVFTGLVQLNDKLEVYGELAQSYQQSDDGLSWTFKLKPNVKFSDGSPLTSEDVAYSLDRALQPSLKSTTAPIYLSLIKDADKLQKGSIKTLIGDSILTPDSSTIVLQTTRRAPYFLQALTYACSYVVQKHLVTKYGNNWTAHLEEGAGSGPWIVSRYTRGTEIVFTPNPNYYGPKPQLKRVVMPFYRTGDTVYKAYQSGQANAAPVPTAQLSSARALPQKQYHSEPQLSLFYYGMNYLTKPFNNTKIRQAFALAIDKDKIGHYIYKDTVIPTNHIVPQGMPGYNANLTGPLGVKQTSGDPAKAKQLFEAGMKEEHYTTSTFPPVTLTVATTGSATGRAEYAAVQQMWKNVLGIHVRIQEEDFNKLLTDIAATLNNPNGLQLWKIGWIADYPDPQDWLSLQFARDSENNSVNYGQNHSRTANQQQLVQAQLETANSNADQQQRLQQYAQAEQQIVNDVGWLPVFQAQSSNVRKPCLKGVQDNAQGLIPPPDWSMIYISTNTICAKTDTYR